MPPPPSQPTDSIDESTPLAASGEAGAASSETEFDQPPPLAQTTPIAAVQAEQRRIAQALHDTVSQSLTATYLQAMVIAQKLRKNGSEATADVARLTDMLHEVVTEMREITRQLTSAEGGSSELVANL